MQSLKLWILLSAFGVYEANNCFHVPGNGPRNFQGCCNVTDIDLKPFAEQCKDYTLSGIYKGISIDEKMDYVNACFFECIWNTTGVMEADTLHMDRLTPILKQYYNEDQYVIDLVHGHTAECAANINNRVEVWRQNGHLMDTPKFQPRHDLHCGWTPMVTTLCAQQKLFTKCPNERKSDAEDCHVLGDFLQRCFEDTIKGPPTGLKVLE